MTTTTRGVPVMVFRTHYDEAGDVTGVDLVNPQSESWWSVEVVADIRTGRGPLASIETRDGVDYLHIDAANGRWIWRLAYEPTNNAYLGRWPD